MDSPVALPSNTPVLNGSDGTNNAFELVGDPVPVELKAVGGGAHIVVRDGSGQVAFTGNLAFGESQTLKGVAPPVRVQSSDGSLVVELDGHDSHRTRAAFERDRQRDTALQLAGYRVLRITYRRLQSDPAAVLGAVRSLLDRV